MVAGNYFCNACVAEVTPGSYFCNACVAEVTPGSYLLQHTRCISSSQELLLPRVYCCRSGPWEPLLQRACCGSDAHKKPPQHKLCPRAHQNLLYTISQLELGVLESKADHSHRLACRYASNGPASVKPVAVFFSGVIPLLFFPKGKGGLARIS